MDAVCENCAALLRAAHQLAGVEFKRAYDVQDIKGEFRGGLPRWTKAAEEGTCRLCRLLFRSRYPTSGARAGQNLDGSQLFWQASRQNARSLQGDLVSTTGGKLTIGVRLNLQVISSDEVSKLRAQRAYIGSHTLSPRVIGRLREWLAICHASHERCRRPATRRRTLPLRLLDVNPDGHNLAPCPQTWESMAARSIDAMPHVRVSLSSSIDMASANSGYLTLSHCWGPKIAMKLTTDLLEEYATAVPVEHLQRDGARVFRDAIQVTRGLGFRYLWIDALCINQTDDGNNEKALEIGRMYQIYAEAAANLSATAAATGVDGMLFDRDDDVRAGLLPFWWCVEGEGEENVHASSAQSDRKKDYMVVFASSRMEDINGGPVNTRGWVFQERCLAPRVIHFCRRQVYWECGIYDGAETDTVAPWLKHYGSHSWKSRHYLPWQETPEQSRQGEVDKTTWLAIFRDLINQFTSFELTYATDRLPAMAGVAQAIAALGHLTETDYCAGLWRCELPQALLWYDTTSQLSNQRSSTKNVPSPPPYTGPTWSWAGDQVSGRFANWEYMDDFENCVEVLDVTITPKYPGGLFGELLEGRLQLRGSVITARRLRLDSCFVFQLQDGQGEQPLFFETRIFEIELLSGEEPGSLDVIGVTWNDSRKRVDALLELPTIQPLDSAQQAKKIQRAKGETVFMLAVGQNRLESGATVMHGLILGPTVFPHQYRRLGYFTTNAPGPSSANDRLRLALLAKTEKEIIDVI